MAKRATVLFFTNAELSQSAVNLATAAELSLDPGYDVHFATFGALGRDLIPQGVTFHVVPGRSTKEIVLSKGLEFMPRHPPGVQGALQSYDEAMLCVMAPHDDEAEYFAVFDHCVALIKKLDPDLVVSDPLFNGGVDAARFCHKRHVILSPGSYKDHSLHLQPNLQVAWKWPV
ncbi:family 1 glycosyltransferase [Apiospora saccharicola]|uniref:Family 1 glycosyltransferase n=1 Tax=Apiospora saccharicola TaxID=335842 RepID=A0ABR1TGA6_9PEZI